MMSRNDSDETRPLLVSKNDNANGAPIEQHRDVHDEGANLVTFEPKGDPDNPLEWRPLRKWGTVLLLCFMAFVVTVNCMGIVPVANEVVRDLEGKKDKSASVLFVTIWELGEATGPLLIAPLSEIFGRWIVFNVANTLFVIGALIAALSPSAKLIIFARFLTGCAVATNVLNPAIVGDIFQPQSRGKGMSAVFLAPLVGGAVGPAVSGALAESLGWRSILWVGFGLAVLCEIAFLTLFRETYAPRILGRRAVRLREETGNENLRTKFDRKEEKPMRFLLRSIARPIRILLSSSILQVLSLWGSLIFAFFYIMSTTLPDMLVEVYGFSASKTGTAFLTFSLGSILGIGVCNVTVDRIYNKLQQQHPERVYPEGRLPMTLIGATIFPAVVVLFGVGPGEHLPVWVLLFSVVLIGFFIIAAIVPMMTYVTDSFGVYSASALTAVLVTRCLMGTFLPLATAPLTERLGFSLGFGVLAVACLVLAPIPILVMCYGIRWRQHCEYTKDEIS